MEQLYNSDKFAKTVTKTKAFRWNADRTQVLHIVTLTAFVFDGM